MIRRRPPHCEHGAMGVPGDTRGVVAVEDRTGIGGRSEIGLGYRGTQRGFE